MIPSTNPATWTVVWDPFVRIGHWALVAAFVIAWLSAEEENGGPSLMHVWAGYTIGAIVIFRVLWGFVGPRHARFRNFVRGPEAVLQHLNDLFRGVAPRHLGHTPAGGAMIVAMLVCLSGTVLTGLVEYGDRGKGPLAGAPAALVTQAYADTDESHRRTGSGRRGEHAKNESILGELHGALASITLALIVVHVLGVALASLIHRENLVTAMITGRKRTE